MTALFIAGAHTDVGKTHVACAMLRAARARGLTVDAFKPVMSGFDASRPEDSDAGRLLAAMGRPMEHLSRVAPLRFAAPVAPPLAAAGEGVRLERGLLSGTTSAWLEACAADLALVEGAGGVMSPLAEDGLNLHLMIDLWLPAVLVGGSYLGAISHTLTAMDALISRNMPLLTIVVCQDADPAAPDFHDTVERLRQFSPTPVVAAPRGADDAWIDPLFDLVP